MKKVYLMMAFAAMVITACGASNSKDTKEAASATNETVSTDNGTTAKADSTATSINDEVFGISLGETTEGAKDLLKKAGYKFEEKNNDLIVKEKIEYNGEQFEEARFNLFESLVFITTLSSSFDDEAKATEAFDRLEAYYSNKYKEFKTDKKDKSVQKFVLFDDESITLGISLSKADNGKWQVAIDYRQSGAFRYDD